MRYTNYEMEQMLNAIGPLLERRDVIGYAAARNARILRGELTEYHKVRDELVMKYGEPDVDEGGNRTGQVSITVDSPSFAQFADELERYANISHEPDIFKIKFDKAIGALSGAEILSCEFMFEE